jgi:hypothetical protein
MDGYSGQAGALTAQDGSGGQYAAAGSAKTATASRQKTEHFKIENLILIRVQSSEKERTANFA